MDQHVVKHARNVRAKEVEKDNLRVGEAPKKKLTLAYVGDRESDLKRAESSGEEYQDVDGAQSESSSNVRRENGDDEVRKMMTTMAMSMLSMMPMRMVTMLVSLMVRVMVRLMVRVMARVLVGK
ncbi:hypothetical protein Scep_009931 [Stephania cephalantha]|uniref:Uncharacterized protein n=1 Tax=Stephania cephalantha TaxID=152367 RepID=A0AAP0JWB9_9MAGN